MYLVKAWEIKLIYLKTTLKTFKIPFLDSSIEDFFRFGDKKA